MALGGVEGGGGGLRAFFRSMAIAASGLSAQRTRIETIAENIANAETTRTAAGGPYRRKVVRLREVPFQEALAARTAGTPALPGGMVGGMPGAVSPEAGGGVEVAGIAEDPTPGEVVYDPGHPDADENGYVRLPNVNLTRELIDLLEARRLYEANASVLDAVKAMLRRATQI